MTIVLVVFVSGCGPSGKMVQKGETTVDNLRLVYDEDQAEARQQAVTVSNDGKLIAFAYDNGTIKIVNLTTGQTAKKMEFRYQDLLEVRFNFDNSHLVLIEKQGTVTVIDVSSESINGSFSLTGQITKIAISSTDDVMAFGMNNGKVLVYELENTRLLQQFNPSSAKIGGLSFHPNDTKIAFSPFSPNAFLKKKRAIYIYDITNGQLINKLEEKIYTALSYSDDGENLYIAGFKKNINTESFFENYNLDTREITKINEKGSFDLFSNKMYYSIDIHGDYLLTTTSENEFEVISMLDGESVYKTNREKVYGKLFDLKTGPKRIYPLYDGHSFLINYSDNNINEIYNAETNKITAYLYSDANDDFAVVSRDGRMEGNEAAISNVAWSERNSNKRVPLDATFDRYYTPSLLQSLLSDDFEYAETEEKNLEKAIELAPDIEITRPDSIFTANQSKVQIEASATSNGDPVKEIQIMVNGKPVGEGQRGLKVAGNRRSIEVELIPGESTISAVAITEAGYRSKPDQVTVNYEGTAPTSDLYVLAVGINEYKNNSLNLNYGRPDAEAFTEAIRRQSKDIFGDIHVTTLYDSEATRSSLQSSMEDIIAQSGPEDAFLLYYAGHGVMSEAQGSKEGDFYMALHEATQLYGNNEGLKRAGISASEMTELTRRIDARKQMIVLDACQSGGAVETFAMRGAAEQKAIIQLARSAGLVVMASTGTEQYATEFDALGHGVFTYALLNGLSGKADGGSEDGKITVKELEAFINDRVPELTEEHRGQSQYPNSYARGQDFPIGVISN